MSSYGEVWDINSKRGFPAGFCEYTINDEVIYAYFLYDDVTDEEKEIILGYIRNNEELMGVRFFTSEEVGVLVDENRTRLKITDGMDADENRIDWCTWK